MMFFCALVSPVKLKERENRIKILGMCQSKTAGWPFGVLDCFVPRNDTKNNK